jgi:hypothetical protein
MHGSGLRPLSRGLAKPTVRLAEIARVFALTAPGDVVHLRLQGKGRSRRKRSQAHAPVTFKLFVLSHMQERRQGLPTISRAKEVGPGAHL